MTPATPSGWEPDQYRLFADQREQPLDDLIALVRPGHLDLAVDLGCGPGEMSARLKKGRTIRRLLGVDNSPSMLNAAVAHAGPGLSFEAGDIARWSADGEYDLVFANASLQWVSDHRSVLSRWTAALKPGGQLAVQVPSNATATYHVLASRIAEREPYRSAFGDGGPPEDVVKANVLLPREYAELLYELGFVEQEVTLRIYPHVLPSSRHVVEWARGTTLTRFKTTLPPKLYDAYIDEYRRELVEQLGPHEPFFFPFSRILLWGRRAS